MRDVSDLGSDLSLVLKQLGLRTQRVSSNPSKGGKVFSLRGDKSSLTTPDEICSEERCSQPKTLQNTYMTRCIYYWISVQAGDLNSISQENYNFSSDCLTRSWLVIPDNC